MAPRAFPTPRRRGSTSRRGTSWAAPPSGRSASRSAALGANPGRPMPPGPIAWACTGWSRRRWSTPWPAGRRVAAPSRRSASAAGASPRCGRRSGRSGRWRSMPATAATCRRRSGSAACWKCCACRLRRVEPGARQGGRRRRDRRHPLGPPRPPLRQDQGHRAAGCPRRRQACGTAQDRHACCRLRGGLRPPCLAQRHRPGGDGAFLHRPARPAAGLPADAGIRADSEPYAQPACNRAIIQAQGIVMMPAGPGLGIDRNIPSPIQGGLTA